MNQKDHKLLYVKSICKTVSFELFGVKFPVRIERDCILKQEGRIFVQITYKSKCKQSNIIKVWHGRKWYLTT
jgi:hypothetical protein